LAQPVTESAGRRASYDALAVAGEAGPLDRVRWVASLAVLATVLGRAVGPSLRGVVVGVDWWVEGIETLGGFFSQLASVMLVSLLLGLTLLVVRAPRLPLSYRIASTALTGIVLGLATPAAFARLTPELDIALALAATFAALISAGHVMIAPSTRAVGVLLGMIGVAALGRQTAWIMSNMGGDRGSVRLAMGARGVATGALAIHVIALVFALLWLATRKHRGATIMAGLCTAIAIGSAYAASAGDALGTSGWRLVLGRALGRLLGPPAPFVPTAVRLFVAVLAVLLGISALFARRERSVVMGAMSLMLLAGADVDLPICGAMLATSALAAVLAALTSVEPSPEPIAPAAARR
jgi:hypothetical protein